MNASKNPLNKFLSLNLCFTIICFCFTFDVNIMLDMVFTS